MGCMTCYSFYTFINQKTFSSLYPAGWARDTISTIIGTLLLIPKGSIKVPEPSQPRTCGEVTDCIFLSKPIPSFKVKWLHCFQTKPGHGDLEEVGKRDVPCSHSLWVCHLAGVTVRGWGSGTHYLRFNNKLCAIPSPEGSSPNFSYQAIATPSL